MNFSPKMKNQDIGNDIYHFGKFLLIFNWEGAYKMRSQIRHRKIPGETGVCTVFPFML